MKHDIKLTILNWKRNLIGVTLSKEPKNGNLKIIQYRIYLHRKKRFAIAYEIVNQKIIPSLSLLKELVHYYKEIDLEEVEKVFATEKKNFENGMRTIANLMNCKGRIATFYWNTLAKIFKKLCYGIHFVKCESKSYSWNVNASDEVNALLDYGYAILESEV
jgi:CRISP-associated protein Cas1